MPGSQHEDVISRPTRSRGASAPERLSSQRTIPTLIVAIGASTDSADSCREILAGLPAQSGMSFILVQQPDAHHQDVIFELLASHTALTVREAVDGMTLELNHLYVVRPGTYSSVVNGSLRLSLSQSHCERRTPLDILLESLGMAYGPRAACIVLSETDAAGGIGLGTVKSQGGLIVAPAEIAIPGGGIVMSWEDIVVLPLAGIPQTLMTFAHRTDALPTPGDATRPDASMPESTERPDLAVNLSDGSPLHPTDQDLSTSERGLRSPDENLTDLNGQLHEARERQRISASDLQNVLYSTGIATIFLDAKLNIRFFTPASKGLFAIEPSDIGHPLAGVGSLVADPDIIPDAQAVLQLLKPVEREVATQNEAWYMRRVLPYRTPDGAVEGVVITFTDISERKLAAVALESAKKQAEQANRAKSTFLAAASHDLRQPLQSLALIQGLLAKLVEGDSAQNLVTLLDQALSAMSGMLNTLLDINQIDAGIVQVKPVRFPVNDLLQRLKGEFTYHAQSHGVQFHVVPCSLSIKSDPLLLEQMIRNLLSNALKYTKEGKVLLGCRRRQNMLSIDIIDTGIGIAAEELQAIFQEYYQVNNAARDRRRGLGLGLSIVQRLSILMGHRVKVHSRLGKGSTFSIEIDVLAAEAKLPSMGVRQDSRMEAEDSIRQNGSILIIDDDPELRQHLALALKGEGHQVAAASDGPTALDLIAQSGMRPDVIVADYNLPNGMNGLEVTMQLREKLRRDTPVLMLTGDISSSALRNIASQKCQRLSKPVKVSELADAIQRLLPKSPTNSAIRFRPALAQSPQDPPVIFVVDDDLLVRQAIRSAFEHHGNIVEDFASCEDFLDNYAPRRKACLLVDAYLPGMNGLELLEILNRSGDHLPTIMITGDSDVSMAVRAMKIGALDFIEKPIGLAALILSVEQAIERSNDSGKLLAWKQSAAKHMTGLSPRQRQIMSLVLAGKPNKIIAADLGISQRTVENHRALIMKKTGAGSLPELARLALAANWNNDDGSPAEEPAQPSLDV